MCRKAIPIIAQANLELVQALKRRGHSESIDMHKALSCETVDVISRFGFGLNFEAVSSFGGGSGDHEFLKVGDAMMLTC